MLKNFRDFYRNQKEKRLEKRNKPWNKKQKIIFLSVFAAVIIYVIVSVIISGKGADGESYSLPSLNLSVNGLDIILIFLLGISFAILKIRAYIKRRKDDKK